MRVGVTAFLTDRSLPPAALARAAEERGFASLYLPEHTHLPLRADRPPALVGGVEVDDYRRSLDPLVALGAAASATERLALGTGVVLVAQHDPIVLAKQVATLDHLSGGRAVLGVGFGWNGAEAADHGVDVRRRREVAADHVACMRALWTMDAAEHHGPFVDLEPCWSWPKPVRPGGVPVLVGAGASPQTFDAVVAWADGWLPIGGAGLARAVPALRRTAEQAGRDPATVRVVPFGTVPTPGKLELYRTLGVDEVVLRVPSAPRDAVLAALDEYARYVVEGSRPLDGAGA